MATYKQQILSNKEHDDGKSFRLIQHNKIR